MAPSKLSDKDKKTILELYRLPEETTSTLAERYGVSNSTISRLLKSHLPEDEYAVLIQQKRVGEKASAAGTDAGTEATAPEPKVAVPEPEVAVPEPEATALEPVQEASASETPPGRPARPILARRKVAEPPAEVSSSEAAQPTQLEQSTSDRRRRSRPRKDSQDTAQLPPEASAEAAIEAPVNPVPTPAEELSANPSEERESGPKVAAEEDLSLLEETSAAVSEDYDDLDDDEDDDDDFDDGDDDLEGDDGLNSWRFSKDGTPNLQALQISPLTAAALPGPCYVVVERTSSELVTCPLRDFAALGQIPEEEVDARTLPIFDNHRVARRFSRRNQRVVKVPDGRMLQKTSPYLQAKGITRLLIDGHIYALGDESSSDRDED